jgi:hypothetical protein
VCAFEDEMFMAEFKVVKPPFAKVNPFDGSLMQNYEYRY